MTKTPALTAPSTLLSLALIASLVACTGAPVDKPEDPSPVNQAPSVTLGPVQDIRLNVQGAIINTATAVISAEVNDDDGNLDYASLTIDGVKKGQNLSLAPFEWASVVFNGLSAGIHTAKVSAFDKDAATTEREVNVTISQNQAPSVSFSNVDDMMEFDSEADLNVQLTATDSDGQVQEVELFLDDQSLGKKTNDNLLWSAADTAELAKISDTGRHQLTARVTDNDGDSVSADLFFTIKDAPVVVEPPKGKLKEENLVALGPYAACAIDANQNARCWGRNYLPGNCAIPRGANGSGEGNCVGRAVPPKNLGKIFALGGYHVGACALLETPANDSNIRCWGPEGASNGPKWTNAVQLAGGDRHVCVLRESGEVNCFQWGSAALGNHKAPNGLNASYISGSDKFNCAIRSGDNKIQCWGNNVKQAPNNITAKAISIGTAHGCAIQSNDVVTCWGDGNGANQPNNLKARSVAAGGVGSCAITLEGKAVCWGNAKAPGDQGNNFVSVFISPNGNGGTLFVKKDRSTVETKPYPDNAKFLPIEKFNITTP